MEKSKYSGLGRTVAFSFMAKTNKKKVDDNIFVGGQSRSTTSSPYKTRTIQKLDEAMSNTQRPLIQILMGLRLGKDILLSLETMKLNWFIKDHDLWGLTKGKDPHPGWGISSETCLVFQSPS